MSHATTWPDALDAFEAALVDLGSSAGPDADALPVFNFWFGALAGPVPDTLVPRARHLLGLARSLETQLTTTMGTLDAQRTLATRMAPQSSEPRPRYVDTTG